MRRFTFDEIVEFFHVRIRWAAERFHTGSLTADDVYQDLIVAMAGYEFEPGLHYCQYHKRHVCWNPTHVNTFIDSRAKDIVRSEARRQRRCPVASELRLAKTESRRADPSLKIDIDSILASLPPDVRQCVMLLAFPSVEVLDLAIADQQQALAESRMSNRLRMNIRRPRVTLQHISKVTGLSRATISRNVARARSAFIEAFSE